jgi:hypothetical protein
MEGHFLHCFSSKSVHGWDTETAVHDEIIL